MKNYEIEYHCDNCNHFFKVKFLVGSKASYLTICVRCGVNAARKAWTNPNPFPPMAPPRVVPWDDEPWWPSPWPRPRPKNPWPRPPIVWGVDW